MRFVVIFMVAALVPVTALAVLPAEERPSPEASALDDQISAAAMAGLEWLLGPEGSGSASSDSSTVNKLYRVVSDEVLAERLLVVGRRVHAEIGRREVPTDLSNRKYLLWGALDPLVKQVIRDRCTGQRSSDDAERLAAHVREHRADLVDRLPLNRRIVAAYYLEQAGMDCCNLYESSLSALRAVLEALPSDKNLANDPLLLYAITHVLFTRSSYYDHYLDPKDFEPELAAIRSAASGMAARGLHPLDLDIAAELLICLKLVRAPADATVESLRRQVVAMQNQDGSWGADQGSGRHATLMATLALVDFAPEFRGEGNIRCAP